MDELADSAPLVNDPAGLRRRLADDGYLFFRGLLPAAEVRTAGTAVAGRPRDGGWMDDRASRRSTRARSTRWTDCATRPRPS